MFGFLNILSGWARERDLRNEAIARAQLRILSEARSKLEKDQMAAADFMRKHDCSIVIIKPDGTMLPG